MKKTNKSDIMYGDVLKNTDTSSTVTSLPYIVRYPQQFISFHYITLFVMLREEAVGIRGCLSYRSLSNYLVLFV